MKRVIALLSLVVACLLLTPVGAQQPPTLIYGVTSAGVPKPFLLGADAGMLLSQRLSYVATLPVKTATAAGITPFFSICGSSTKTLRIQSFTVGGSVGTAAVYADVTLRKTSTSTSAGTATALTAVPLDSSDAATTANLLNYYTVLATAGALVGTADGQSAVFPITGTVAAAMAQVVFDYTNRQEMKAPVLRGTAQCLEAGFGTTTTNAPTLLVSVRWTEE